MIYIIAALIISVVLVCHVGAIKQLDESEKRAIERQKILQDWLFNSLYSIDHKVLLPTELEKPMTSKKAKVYSPTEDGMAEFNGMKDDL
jgi:hypothetical protein